MGSAPDIVVISSDDDEEYYPVSRPRVNMTNSSWKKGIPNGVGVDDDDDDDDCVILDGDPDRAFVTVKSEKVGCGGSDELEVIAEKGKIACRDFPHSRHLCSNLPFSTTPHKDHCSMCYCFVCDTPAPCDSWGKGFWWIDDHCHATDKEAIWRTRRMEFRRRSQQPAASRPENNLNFMFPELHDMRLFQVPLPLLLHPYPKPNSFSFLPIADADPLHRLHCCPTLAVPDIRPTPSAAEATTVSSAQAALPTAGAGRRDTSNIGHTGQVTDHPVTVPGAADETNPPEVYSEECVAVAPRHEEATVYVGNLPYNVDREYLAQLFRRAGVVEDADIVFYRETDRIHGYGFVTMSTVEEAEKAVEIFHDSKLNERVMIVYKQAAPPSQSGSSSLRIYVCNLPRKVDDSWLEDLFSEYGQVVDAEIVWEYRGKTRRSRGYGFVTMATQEGRDYAIAFLDKQIFEGRSLQVKVAKEQRPQRE